MKQKEKLYGGPWWVGRNKLWVIKPYAKGITGLPSQKYAPGSIGEKDRAAAVRWADEYIAIARRTGVAPGYSVQLPAVPALKAANFHSQWLEIRRRYVAEGKIRTGTLASNSAAIAHVLKTRVRDVPFVDLTTSNLKTFVAELKALRKTNGELYSANHILNVYNTFSAMVHDALREELVPEWRVLKRKNIAVSNPLGDEVVREDLPEPVTKVGKGKKVCMMRAGAEDFLSRFPKDIPYVWLLIFRAGVLTGLRVGELFGLKWSDLKVVDGMVYLQIDRQFALYAEHGTKGLSSVKTESGVRPMPVHSALHGPLKTWRATEWRDWTGRKPTHDDPIFPGPDGAHWRPHAAETVRRCLGLMGLPTHVHGLPLDMRSLRRTFATLGKEFGISKDIRKELHGHSRGADVLDRHYTADVIRPLHEAIERIKLDIPEAITSGAPFARRSGHQVPEHLRWALVEDDDDRDGDTDDADADPPAMADGAKWLFEVNHEASAARTNKGGAEMRRTSMRFLRSWSREIRTIRRSFALADSGTLMSFRHEMQRPSAFATPGSSGAPAIPCARLPFPPRARLLA
jgi:integrase